MNYKGYIINKEERQEIIDTLIQQDIDDIVVGVFNKDYEYLYAVLSGEGFIPYNQWTDKELLEEYENRKVD